MLVGEKCLLRAYRADDAERLRELADDFSVVRWMTRRFPHPFTHRDAENWIAQALSQPLVDQFVIEAHGAMVGNIGIDPHSGEQSGVAEFGYWLGRPYWGQGIASEAAQLLSNYALAERYLRRLEAHVFGPNIASARVLEKSGFTLEGVFKHRVTDREGNILEELLYARFPNGISTSNVAK